MSRFRLLFEGELRDGEDVVGLSEQIGMRLEDLADVRLLEVRRELCGCLICQHGTPIEGSFERKVWCRKADRAMGAMDCCSKFEELDVIERMKNRRLDHRIERFNKFFRGM